GYHEIAEVRPVLSPVEWERLQPFLATQGTVDNKAYFYRSLQPSGFSLFRDPRHPVNLDSASREVLAALQMGLSCHYPSEYFAQKQDAGLACNWLSKIGPGYTNIGHLFEIQTTPPSDAVTVNMQESAQVADFLIANRNG